MKAIEFFCVARVLASLSVCLCSNSLAFAEDSALRKKGESPDLSSPDLSSPDWRSQIVYFVLTDRFSDGDSTNNSFGKSEFAYDESHYNGGDLFGVTQKLDYISGLGATAVWITPPVANQWWNGDQKTGYGGYHGYWARNFMAVDEHQGTLETYQNLAREIHNRGMLLMQDIVLNHVGRFFQYKQWSPQDPLSGWRPVVSVPAAKPEQAPFDLNNPNNKTDFAAAIYHFTPEINFSKHPSEQELHNFSLAGLNDLNTENPLVGKVLRESYRYWLKEVGVDAFRIDTAKYVPASFLEEFLYKDSPSDLGINKYAETLGKNYFYTVAEVWDRSYKEVAKYTASSANHKLPTAGIDFPMQSAFTEMLVEGKPTHIFSQLMQERHSGVVDNPQLLLTFLDSHDMPRWLENGSLQSLQQGLLLLLTLPGVPCVYYGTEQGFSVSRAAMFSKGYASGGQDHFDTNAPMYKWIAKLSKLRKSSKAFTHGTWELVADNEKAPGILVYRRKFGDESYVVMVNSSPKSVRAIIPPQVKNFVWEVLESSDDSLVGRKVMPSYSSHLHPLKMHQNEDELVISGRGYFVFRETEQKKVSKFACKANCDSFARLSSLGGTSVSEKDSLKREAKTILAEVASSLNDDAGPNGNYVYPSDSSYSHQADIAGAKIFSANGDLSIEFKMQEVTDSWKPRFGFDHVTFSVFLQSPESASNMRVMPFHHAQLPGNMVWDFVAFCHGWNARLGSSLGASDVSWGTVTDYSPELVSDIANKTITIKLPGGALGNPKRYSGWKVYVATWDYEGMSGKLRPLLLSPTPWGFGGGNPDGSSPHIIDSVGPVLLK